MSVKKGQISIAAVIMTAITIAAYLVAILPLLSAAIDAAGITGLEGLVVKALPLLMFIGIIVSVFHNQEPQQAENAY